MNGWFILDKPTGISSAHAVAKVKRLLKPKKIGHAGTLDPLACGVLPLAMGEATKTMAYMIEADKSYRFTVQWGQERDTDDSMGQITAQSDIRPTRDQIEALLPSYTGDIMQLPPNYSAIKIDGKRAYAMARAGEEVILKSRPVKVYKLEIESETPDSTTLFCHCGKGTYIRSLARDIGRQLGCYGHITYLRRTSVGKFSENHAISLENLTDLVHKGDLSFILPAQSALDDIPAWEVTSRQALLLRQGQPIPTDHASDHPRLLAYDEGKLLAICEVSHGTVKAVRVFNL
jgi:tRNA pseudouridine55 synthase